MTGSGGDRIESDLPTVSAETVAASIAADATLLVSGFGSVGYPKAIPAALAAADRDLSLTLVSGGSVGGIERTLVEAGAVSRRYPYQSDASARAAVNAGCMAYSDRHVSTLGDDVRFGGLVDPDIAVVEAVAVGENWLVPSTSIGHTPAFVESVDRLVVEVNAAQPRALAALHDVYRRDVPPDRETIPLDAPGERIGGPRIPFDAEKLEAVVETDQRDDPYTFRDPTAADRAIAANLGSVLAREVDRSPLFEDSLRIQFGVGSLGNALVQALGDADLGDRDVVYYGEVIQDGLLDLIQDGTVRTASATSLALSTSGQDRLFADLKGFAEDVVLRPTDVSNNPGVVDRFGIVSVNSALEVDLYGHVNSTHVNGSRLMNGVGGSGDFTRNSALSIVAVSATADDGAISRIVPMVPHVDHTEHDIDVIVTDEGVADLRGLAPHERAAEIVEQCAHDSFRPALETYLERAARGGGHIYHDLDRAFDWQ